MKINNAFLANHAETREGLAFISGGFPEWYTVPSLPITAPLAAVWVLELEQAEIGLPFTFELAVVYPSRLKHLLAHVGVGRSHDTRTVEGAPLYVIVTYVFGVEFQVEGLHTFEVVSENQVMATMPLFVNLEARGGTEEAEAEDLASRFKFG